MFVSGFVCVNMQRNMFMQFRLNNSNSQQQKINEMDQDKIGCRPSVRNKELPAKKRFRMRKNGEQTEETRKICQNADPLTNFKCNNGLMDI